MCGIFGLVLQQGARVSRNKITRILAELYQLSESRGKESAGLHVFLPDNSQSWALKAAMPASKLIRSREYRTILDEALALSYTDSQDRVDSPAAFLAHSRLVTNGSADLSANNQPVSYDGVSLVHNGIVVNAEQLWQEHPELKRCAEVDTEVIAALIQVALSRGDNAAAATASVYESIRGAATVAWTHKAADWLVLATNTGDLYSFYEAETGIFLFASEKYILERVIKKLGICASPSVNWITAGTGKVIPLELTGPENFKLGEVMGSQPQYSLDISKGEATHRAIAIGSKDRKHRVSVQADESLLKYNEKGLLALKRCSACILPETFPYIEFDNSGVCNYCRNYQPHYKGVDPETAKKEFLSNLERITRTGITPNVIVPFSGGRDSCYGLHLIKKEFNLNPITFTYDWGMVTDLARRNIARLCGELGVPNILVSADIKKKRDYIRKNVSAWLRKPDLGMVPLFMAGDKHFFKVVNDLKRQTGVGVDIWSGNLLENTDFKSGYCGVAPDFDKELIDYLSMGRKVKLASYYASRFLMNPGYVNSSIIDTLKGFTAYYLEPRNNYFSLFNHLVWSEQEVNRVLADQYDFEIASDTTSTWRIGDGTAPFYNYIYVTARGFSEFDTFRSNQIREGMISRDEAMSSVIAENRPRAESLRWYLYVVGLDYASTINKINELDDLGIH